MSCSIHTWTATASRSGSGRKLAVVGKGECPRAGFRLHLVRDTPGANPDATVVALRLVIDASQARAEVVTSATVHYEDRITTEATRVTIRTPAGNHVVEIRNV